MKAGSAYDAFMITAIIETHDDEVALAHALAALVPAATEGVLREVVVIDHDSGDGTLVVADAAGCTIVRARAVSGDPRRFAAERARGDWLLFLSPATAMEPNWIGQALTFIDRAMVAGDASATARFRGGKLVGRWRARASDLWRWLISGRDRERGLLVSKTRWLAITAASPLSAASSVSGARRGAA